jgi:glutamate--cysteine ligase catalytic subunit
MHSDDKKIQFLHKVSSRAMPSNTEMKRIGSSTPLFRKQSIEKDQITSLLDGQVAVEDTGSTTSVAERSPKQDLIPLAKPESKETVRAAIHMDAMAFGMGCCCLQITFQAQDVEESRFIYDQLAVLAPIMMALTASTPILKGRIADTDCRWGIISESVDDRTFAERGREDSNAPHEHLNANGERRIYKSRYDSISTYIYQGALYLEDEYNTMKKSGLANRVLNIYNDIPVPIDEDSYQQLRKAGIDPALAQHVAHLFIRDPLVVFAGSVEEIDDETQTEHWESIQSTNWYVDRYLKRAFS